MREIGTAVLVVIAGFILMGVFGGSSGANAIAVGMLLLIGIISASALYVGRKLDELKEVIKR